MTAVNCRYLFKLLFLISIISIIWVFVVIFFFYNGKIDLCDFKTNHIPMGFEFDFHNFVDYFLWGHYIFIIWNSSRIFVYLEKKIHLSVRYMVPGASLFGPLWKLTKHNKNHDTDCNIDWKITVIVACRHTYITFYHIISPLNGRSHIRLALAIPCVLQHSSSKNVV